MKIHFRNHPIHTILAHFPAALFPTGLIFDLISLLYNETSFLVGGYYCQFMGLVLGIVTAVLGFADLYGLYERNDQRSLKLAFIHGGINSLVITTYVILVFIRSKDYPQLTGVPAWLLATEIMAVLSLVVGNYFGGEVYQRIIRKSVER